ncbi:hypothetical protein VTL71DRAFT_4212 [Oculimacula yallundae]|uniref:Uncharacterized protein n=1 Tax=Oculimacula yallundae TaxID=86028 RepID=A0ABR4C6D4_9HELO
MVQPDTSPYSSGQFPRMRTYEEITGRLPSVKDHIVFDWSGSQIDDLHDWVSINWGIGGCQQCFSEDHRLLQLCLQQCANVGQST